MSRCVLLSANTDCYVIICTIITYCIVIINNCLVSISVLTATDHEQFQLFKQYFQLRYGYWVSMVLLWIINKINLVMILELKCQILNTTKSISDRHTILIWTMSLLQEEH